MSETKVTGKKAKCLTCSALFTTFVEDLGPYTCNGCYMKKVSSNDALIEASLDKCQVCEVPTISASEDKGPHVCLKCSQFRQSLLFQGMGGNVYGTGYDGYPKAVKRDLVYSHDYMLMITYKALEDCLGVIFDVEMVVTYLLPKVFTDTDIYSGTINIDNPKLALFYRKPMQHPYESDSTISFTIIHAQVVKRIDSLPSD